MAKGIDTHFELQELYRLIRAEEAKREERDRAMGDPDARLLMESATLSPSQQDKIKTIQQLLLE